MNIFLYQKHMPNESNNVSFKMAGKGAFYLFNIRTMKEALISPLKLFQMQKHHLQTEQHPHELFRAGTHSTRALAKFIHNSNDYRNSSSTETMLINNSTEAIIKTTQFGAASDPKLQRHCHFIAFNHNSLVFLQNTYHLAAETKKKRSR